MKMIVAASLAALAFGAILPASAQSVPEIVVTGTKASAPPGTAVKSKTVKYADLDLGKSAGVKTLYSRIKAAAKDVCSPQPAASDMDGTNNYNQCVSHAVDSAVAQVGNADLTAMAANTAH